MATIKNRDEACVCGCGSTRGSFIEELISGPVKLPIDVAADIWEDQQKTLKELEGV